ncbi:MAG: extensin family protein [Rhodobacteraceae bacterium]|nr:extensin family protein [Paracoccaceae bacterium]
MPRPAVLAQDFIPRTPLVPVRYDATIRPRPRPGPAPTQMTRRPIVLVPVHYAATIRPRPRPIRALAATPVQVIEVASGTVMLRSARPEPRPRTPYQQASLSAAGVRSQPAAVMTGKGGKICGDPAIRGEVLAPIPGRVKGCGVARPVRVSSVDGVPLSRPATMDCDTARALKAWVATGVKPTVGRLGGGVASVKVIADYACRPRNNQPGAKISEHGRGRALDVAAINLNNGVSLSVLKGWRDPVQGKLLKQMHKAACGPFGTVLGPNANRYHQDHFHLDTARYSGGPYCR